jgi:hypothetical protein
LKTPEGWFWLPAPPTVIAMPITVDDERRAEAAWQKALAQLRRQRRRAVLQLLLAYAVVTALFFAFEYAFSSPYNWGWGIALLVPFTAFFLTPFACVMAIFIERASKRLRRWLDGAG